MIDPKAGLTRFSQIDSARSRTRAEGQLSVSVHDIEVAGHLAGHPAFLATSRERLTEAQQRYSISTVEELLALARVDAKRKSGLLKRIGIPPELVGRLTEAFVGTDRGAAEVDDWRRFEQLDYTTGFHADFAAPPPSPHLLGAALGVAAPVLPGGVSLIPRFGPIRDQAGRGTCTAFAAVACLELAIRNTAGIVDLSEQFAYWNMVTTTGRHDLISIFPLLKTSGVCLESVWPYYPNPMSSNDAQGPPPPDAVAAAARHRCGDVLQLPPRDVNAIQLAIAQERAVAIGIPVYPSWMDSPVVRKYGNITVPLPGEVREQIGHAIALVGYQDDASYAGGGYFILRNSWNSYWAEQSVLGVGYGTIPYLYVTDFNWDAWCIV